MGERTDSQRQQPSRRAAGAANRARAVHDGMEAELGLRDCKAIVQSALSLQVWQGVCMTATAHIQVWGTHPDPAASSTQPKASKGLEAFRQADMFQGHMAANHLRACLTCILWMPILCLGARFAPSIFTASATAVATSFATAAASRANECEHGSSRMLALKREQPTSAITHYGRPLPRCRSALWEGLSSSTVSCPRQKVETREGWREHRLESKGGKLTSFLPYQLRRWDPRAGRLDIIRPLPGPCPAHAPILRFDGGPLIASMSHARARARTRRAAGMEGIHLVRESYEGTA
ncbi:hypothetical protein RJ55_06239 [Drechmeria coniospora]|nr:hypothetical protein RJ55_06239 [Drechmeria coniospora]